MTVTQPERHLEVFVEGEWLSVSNYNAPALFTGQALEETNWVYLGPMTVEHSRLGKIQVVPSSFPGRIIGVPH